MFRLTTATGRVAEQVRLVDNVFIQAPPRLESRAYQSARKSPTGRSSPSKTS